MKVYYDYEKTITEWVAMREEFPNRFDVRIEKGIKNLPYEDMLNVWISKRMEFLTRDEDCRNVVVNMDEKEIFYELLSEDYEDVTDVLEIETVSDLVAMMKKLDCSYFAKDGEKKSRWVIS
jgi:hypothetical protein